MPAPVQSWADDVESTDFPARTETTDKDGIVTIVEYRVNEEGKKVKVTRRIKRTLVKSTVNHHVAERMGWAKFGAEKGKKAGPDTATTTVGEAVRLRLQPGNVKQVDEAETETKKPLFKKIACRLCQGDHYTSRCPYKETLGGITGEEKDDFGMGGDGAVGGTASDLRANGGKYVAPAHRPGAKGGGESMNRPGGNRDDLPTLRVTNISEDTEDHHLWDLIGHFARPNRIYLGKDQETGLCKGFAFVSFDTRRDAELAMAKLHNLPWDHQILHCTWSVPKSEVAK